MERGNLDLGGMNLDSLIEKANEGTYEGADDLEPQQGIDSPEIHPEVPSGIVQVPEQVLLVNIDFKEETIFIPDSQGRFTGEKVKFMDGYLNTSRERANWILANNPHIYEETPTEAAPFEAPDGFKTWSPVGYQRYLAGYYASL